MPCIVIYVKSVLKPPHIMQASIIVFLLAIIIATGGCLTAAFGGRYAILDLAHHSNIQFSSLCSSEASS